MEQPPPISPDLLEELDALAELLAQRPDHADLARKLEWLVDALVIRGQLPRDHAKRLANLKTDRSPVRLAVVGDKYLERGPDLDCASRLHLCEARCCRSEVALSAQDLRDGIPFELHRPYLLPRDPQTKQCVCLDERRACTIYEQRPAPCRVYDCRGDPRVWIDFDARIPAPMPEPARSERRR